MSKISDQDSQRRDARYGLRPAQVRTDLSGVSVYELSGRPGEAWSFPGACFEAGGRCHLQPFFAGRGGCDDVLEPGAEVESSLWRAKAVELDCVNPLCLQCMVCGDVHWKRCGGCRESSCRPCARRWLRAKRHQINGALEAFAHHGFCVSWLTITFPGFGGCERWCGCHEARRRLGAGADVGVWNGTFTKRFHDFKQDLERLVGFRIEYCRALEPQNGDRLRSGAEPTKAFHAHVWLVSARPIVLTKTRWRKLLAKHGFGHSFHFVDVPAEFIAQRVEYNTSYVKGSADLLRDCPYVHPVSGEAQPSKCRPFTMSRGFADPVVVSQRRWYQRQRDRQAVKARWEAFLAVGNADGVPASGLDGAAGQGAAGCDGAAGAFKCLLDELHRLDEPVLPSHRLGVAM